MEKFPPRFEICNQLLINIAALVLFCVGFAANLSAQATHQRAWAVPKPLLQSLSELEQLPIVSVWANETRQVIESIVEPSLNPVQRAELVRRLADQHAVVSKLNQSVWKSDLPDDRRLEISARLLAFRYELTRRIATWSTLSDLSPNPNSANNIKSRSLGQIDFSELDPTWAEYLLLHEFQKTFETQEPSEKDKRELARKILGRIYSPVLKPEQAKYVQGLFQEDVIDFLKAHASRPVDSSNLARRLELYERSPSARSGYLLNEIHQDLLWSNDQSYRQAAQSIETHYRNANFRLTVSQKLMNRLLPELPTIAEPVSDVVQGARVSGRSETSNDLKVALVPDKNQLNFQIQTNGFVQSDAVAKTKGIRILNQGHASYLVTKQISVNRDGFDTSHKPYANSTARQVLVDIQTKMDNVPLFGHIARRAAEKRIREKNPETTQLFRRKVAKQAEIRVEKELLNQVEKVRTAATKNLLDPLVSMDLDPVPMQLTTTDSEIIIRYRLAGRDQMAANTARPLGDQNSLLEFQLHQSLINNAIARLGLSGETFTGPELAAHLEDVFGFKAKKNADQPEEEVELTFEKLDPIQIEFGEDRVNLVVNLASLKIGDMKPLHRLSMTASYVIGADGMLVSLTRDHEGTRTAMGGRRRIRVGDRAKISTIMQMMFEDSYTVNALPKKFREKQEASRLAVSRLIVTNGWLGVSFGEHQTAKGSASEDRTGQRIGDNLRRLLERR